jgi:hypothetical protein
MQVVNYVVNYDATTEAKVEVEAAATDYYGYSPASTTCEADTAIIIRGSLRVHCYGLGDMSWCVSY